MSLTAPQNTLRYHSTRPTAVERDMSWVPFPEFAAGAKPHFTWFGSGNCMGKNPMAPEWAAMCFYLLQHTLAEIRQRRGLDTPLAKQELELVESYHHHANAMAHRMMLYVWAICLRESRHKHWNSEREAKFRKACGDVMADWYQQCVSKGSGEETFVKYALTNPPACTLGEFTNGLVRVFMDGGYSAMFGGKKWKEIAVALDDFVNGKVSGAMFLDRAFNLAHNTAPIFNKGMLFECQDKTQLNFILDTQHASMIPQLVRKGSPVGSKWIDSELLSLADLARTVIGEAFDGEVDWHKVEAYGKGNVTYSALKKNTNAAGSKWADAKAKAAAQAAVKKAESVYVVDHNTELKKLKREEL